MALLGNLTGSSQFFNNTEFYKGVATQSLRFDDGSNAYLTRTPSSAGNRKTYTFSCWIKRGNLTSDNQTLIIVRPSSTPSSNIQILDSNIIRIQDTGISMDLRTTQVFRDLSAWYHIIVAVDTTQSTSSNRAKLYVNGSQVTSFSTETYPTQNGDTLFNSTSQHEIGDMLVSGTQNFDGYMAEVNFVDGLALDASYFGETKNGVWIAKQPSVTYGTNGFRLQFNQTGVGTASASTIGADTSGNTHHFTSSGIVASDCNMPDSPENNFCTMNPLDTRSGFALSEGSTKLVAQSGAGTSRSTIGMSTGKWYFEFIYTGLTGGGLSGITNHDAPLTSHVGSSAYGWGYRSTGDKHHDTTSTSYGATYTTGDVIGVAFDADNGDLVFYKNNASQGTAFTGLASDTYFPSFGDASTSDASTMIANFGQDSSFAGNKTAQGNTDGNGIGDFYYAPPSGYLALCTSNLPEPTISPNADTQADDYFTPYIWTGNGSNPRAFTDVGFQADWIWIKKRSGSGTSHHLVADSSRGDGKTMLMNESNAEATNDVNGTVSDTTTVGGFTVNAGSTSDEMVNDGSDTYVAWLWKANGGTTVTNEDGSIDSTVQANTDAGFSIVTYTGRAGQTDTIGHGLGVVPDMYIVKRREAFGTPNWAVYHKGTDASSPQNYFTRLDTNVGRQASSTIWNNTAPTSSVFSVGTSNVSNYNQTFVAYCFTEIEGYSKFGNYTGAGTDLPFVHTGFAVKYLMMKRTDNTGRWYIWDNTRENVNPVNLYLRGDLSNTESGTETGQAYFDFLSNGFKLRANNTAFSEGNTSGANHIYMAFASNPFKYSVAQ